MFTYFKSAGKRQIKRTKALDAKGRLWTISFVPFDQLEEEDSRFWLEELTPEERVNAVTEATLSCLKARGLNGFPRFRRIYRRIELPQSKVPDRGRARTGNLRATTGDKRS